MYRATSRSLPGSRLLCLFVACLLLIPAGAWAVSIRLEPLTLHPGETATTNLSLESIASGLSGYQIGLKLTTPGIAEIVNVTFPQWAGLNDREGFPGSDVTFKAVSFDTTIDTSSGSTVLATVTVKGLKSGVTGVTFGELYFEDSQGSQITPQVQDSQITVSSGAPGQQTTVPTTTTVSAGTGGGTGVLPTTKATTKAVTPATTPAATQGPQQTTGQGGGSGQSGGYLSQGSQTPSATTSPEMTTTSVVPPRTTPSRGMPFLSVAGIAGLMAAIAVTGTLLKKR